MTELSFKVLLFGRSRGQSMAEFAVAAVVAVILLFIAIQFAAIGRDAVALGDLNYQLARWATDGPNNNAPLTASPSCQDLVSLIKTGSAGSFDSFQGIANGYIGRIAHLGGVTCAQGASGGGIAVYMTCAPVGSSTFNTANCSNLRAHGSAVQITLVMDTKYTLFLTTSGYSFLGIPFPRTLSNTQTAYTQ
jgi:uncharacterized protein (UPF0333 family)